MESTSVGVATRVRITACGRITTDSEVGSGVAGIIAGVGLATGEFERIGGSGAVRRPLLGTQAFLAGIEVD